LEVALRARENHFFNTEFSASTVEYDANGTKLMAGGFGGGDPARAKCMALKCPLEWLQFSIHDNSRLIATARKKNGMARAFMYG